MLQYMCIRNYKIALVNLCFLNNFYKLKLAYRMLRYMCIRNYKIALVNIWFLIIFAN